MLHSILNTRCPILIFILNTQCPTLNTKVIEFDTEYSILDIALSRSMRDVDDDEDDDDDDDEG